MKKRIRRDHVLSELRKINLELSKKYGVTKIGIFGSVAREEATEDSDIDIVFQIEKPNLYTTIHIKQDLEKLLHMPVDLVRYRNTMNPFLKKRIDSEGIYV